MGDAKPIKKTIITVAIEHTWVGDLLVRLVPPAATGVGVIVLHNRSGGSADNLTRSYNPTTTSDLTLLTGKVPTGQWKLEVNDNATADTGNIQRFTVELEL